MASRVPEPPRRCITGVMTLPSTEAKTQVTLAARIRIGMSTVVDIPHPDVGGCFSKFPKDPV